MDERVREAGGFGHILQDFSDFRMWHPLVQIEDQCARFLRHISFQTLDTQLAVFDNAIGKSAGPDSCCKPLEAILQPALSILNPNLWIQRKIKPRHRLCGFQRHQKGEHKKVGGKYSRC